MYIFQAQASEYLGFSAVNVTRYAQDLLFPYVRTSSHLDDVIIWDTHISGIPVRMYKPPGHQGSQKIPGVVYYHGGGWTLLSIGNIEVFKI